MTSLDNHSHPDAPPVVRGAAHVDVVEAAAQVVALARELAPSAGRTRVLAVDGLSGSGKSTLAWSVANGLAAPLLNLDEVYAGWDGLVDVGTLLNEWVIAPLVAGRSPRWQLWDWVESRRSDEWREAPAGEFLVIEGCGAGALSIAEHVGLLVWVDAHPAIRSSRIHARADWPWYAPHADNWRAQELHVHARDRTRERADVVVINDTVARITPLGDRVRRLVDIATS